MKNKDFILLGVLCALAIALQIIENIFVLPFPIPGGKLGLANIVFIIILYRFGLLEGIYVTIIKCLIVALLQGGVSSLMYSIPGGLGSVVLMWSLLKYVTGVGFIGIGVLGACTHNILQTIVATVIMKNIYIMNYIWLLLIISVGAGGFTGFLADHTLHLIGIKKINKEV